MKPITKLNLNMNPSVCTDGSLVFAKNMKVDKDGCLTNDYGYKNIEALKNYNIVGHIVGLDNKIYLFTDEVKQVQIGTEEQFIPYDEEESTLYKHIIENLYSNSFFDSSEDNDFYFYIEPINNTYNTSDNYKLSELGFNSDTLDTFFGFCISYKPNDDNPISTFFTELLEKIEEIVGIFTTVKYSTKEIIEGNTLGSSAANHTFFTTSNISTINVKGVHINEDESWTIYNVYQYNKQAVDSSEIGTWITKPVYKKVNTVLEFDEITQTVKIIECGWKYNNGNITGCVTTNVTGEKILTIAESEVVQYIYNTTRLSNNITTVNAPQQPGINLQNSLLDARINDVALQTSIQTLQLDDSTIENESYENSIVTITETIDEQQTVTTRNVGIKNSVISLDIKGHSASKNEIVSILVPIKHINLSYCKYEDDESIYTQAPKVPIANVNLIGTYAKTIPNGTYVFFIRYQIRKDVYTNWHLCSRPIFAGVSETTNTIQGGLKYINLHKDSAKSFIFDVSFIEEDYKKLYDKFQLGFIISHDDSVNARSWKTFDINAKSIYFDYDNVGDIDIDELQKTTYEIYNVSNVTSFKNKLYISNYVESNFNPEDIKSLASNISLSVIKSINNVDNSNFKVNNYILKYNNIKGYYDGLANGGDIRSILSKELFDYSFVNYIVGETKIKDKVLTFDMEWHSTQDPDFMLIHNIVNNLNGEKPFGDTWQPGFVRATNVIEQVYYKNNLWAIAPNYDYLHPWFSLGFTFMYGSRKRTDSDYPPYYINHVGLFNKNSLGVLAPQSEPNLVCWTLRDEGFDGTDRLNTILNNITSEITSQNRLVEAYIYVTSGATKYKIGYLSSYDDDNYIVKGIDEGFDNIEVLNNEIKQNILKNEIYYVLSSYIVGITQDGTPVLNIDGTDIQTNNITVVYKQYEFEVSNTDTSTEEYWKNSFTVKMTTKDYSYICSFRFKDNIITITEGDTSINSQASTLMPHSKYKAYVHFVDEHNIITNGVYIGDIQTGGIDNITDILSLQYSITNITNSKYKAFFISLENVGNKIIECFAYSKDGENNYLHSIELDSLLYNLNNNIKIINNNGDVVTTVASYHSSGETNPVLAFGNCGYITWKDNVDYTDNVLFIEIDSDNTNVETNTLIKATNYLPLVNTTSAIIYDGFYGSYLCTIKKPSFALSSDCYVSGKDIYKVTRAYPLIITEFDSTISIQNSTTYMIRSNFNLNYLNLSEDINDQIFTIGSASSGQKQVAKVINSAILSYIYELQSMYKDFNNIYFNKITEYNKIDFNNTIRVSNTLSDESFNNSVFMFEPTSYYNIPTDRGIIVKLFSIGNDILVHTKGSLYKFDASVTIVGQEDDIKLKESDPFDTGITQILDSQYGYGGIDNKEAGCVTFDSYFFFDKVSKHIFGYGGDNQIINIDDTIVKFIEEYNPNTCRTIHDEKNDRVLFEFVSGRTEDTLKINKTFCISYNYKTKSFISLHDLTLLNSFNSRYGCYSYKNKFVSLFTNLNVIDTSVIESDNGTWNIYGAATVPSVVSFGTSTYNKNQSPFNVAIIMLAVENTRENIDSVKYIANIIKSSINKKSNIGDLFTVTQQDITNPVSRFYIITDICISSEIKTTINDTVRPNSLLDYKGFKYNLGSWNGNYFRNILNADNIYNYPNPAGTGRDIVSDNNSLVYGRYFVLFFEFLNNKAIKFEDIVINSNKY